MQVLRELRSWLGRSAGRGKSLPRKGLRFERLEDRLTPTTTGTELLAVTNSSQPLQDLFNVVSAFNLGSSVDFSRTNLVLSSNTTSLLQIGLTDTAILGNVRQQLLDTGLYASVAPNFIYSSGLGDLREATPNDPQFNQQYHHLIIKTPDAWDKTIGEATTIVAILDDGVFVNHPDLRNTVWSNAAEIAGDGIDNDGNGFRDDVNGWNFVANTNNVNPSDAIADSHGTQVAGLLAAQFNNALGVTGVAGGARFMPLKVVGTGGTTTSLALARAIGYAVNNGAKIINTSINIDPFVDDPTFAAAVSLAYDRGILLINSAGNSNANNPARVKLEELIVVAASDRNDVKTAYSNYGSGIDITAPGGTSDDGLLTTIPLSGYAAGFGTSMGAPLVAGVAALVWSAFPGYTRDQVAAAILANADSLLAKNPSFEDQLGAGRLNAAKAVSGLPIVTKLGKLTGLPAEGADAPDSLTTFNLRLNSPLDAATVIPSNFELRWAGLDNTFGTSDDELLPFTINDGRDYKIGTNDLTFAVNQSLERGLYRFTAKSGGLRDPFGGAVDGDGNGTAGGNLVRNFGVAYQLGGRVYDDIRDDGFSDPSDPPLAGVPVFIDMNGNGQLDRVVFTANIAAIIPDADPVGVSAPISVVGVGSVAGGLSVTVFVSHPRLNDLQISLVAPDGSRVLLFDRRALDNPGQGTSFLLTFEDGIVEDTDSFPTITMHRLRPHDPLAGFIGKLANGNWQIEVADLVTGQTGLLNSASLGFSTEPTAITDANGFFAFNGLPTGSVVLLNAVAAPGYRRAANGGAVAVDLSMPNPAPVSIGLSRTDGIVGRVLRDSGDGTFANAVGLAGAIVFLDENRDGLLGAGEFLAVTDEFGNYAFPSLANGLYAPTVLVEPGFAPSGAQPVSRTIALTPSEPVARGVDFLVRRDTVPVVVTPTPVSPSLRNTPVSLVSFQLSEPLPSLNAGHFTLTRNGAPVTLLGTTLVRNGSTVSLIGLELFTAMDGYYELTLNAPPPAGEPGRQPIPTTVAWTNDAAKPVLTLSGIFEGGAFVGVRVVASEPIVGLNRDDFFAMEGKAAVSIQASTFDLAPDGRSAEMRFPAEVIARNALTVELRGAGSGIVDLAGNAYTESFFVAFAKPVSPPPPPPPIQRRTVVGADVNGPPTVKVFDTATNELIRTMPVFEPFFTGGVRVAAGDVNGDGVEDIIAAAGPGGGPRVRVFDGVTFAPLLDFLAFEETFTGGVFASVGDLNGDGKSELVLSADVGGGPRVRIVNATTGATIADFFGIADENFRGGARTAIGDVNGDGTPDLLVAAGVGGGPRVAGYDGKSLANGPTRLFADFFAFDPGLRDGVFLGAGRMNSDIFADLVIGAGAGGGPRVLVLSGRELTESNGQVPLADFFSGDEAGRAGIRVAVKSVAGNAQDSLVTADGRGAGTRVRLYSSMESGQNPPMVLEEFDAFESPAGGVFVG
ncbi:MAG: S8 family serine peptidase [Gemmataceae bacterium]|nr:S8 family serine peptidase [Gemmataceae bacterium]